MAARVRPALPRGWRISLPAEQGLHSSGRETSERYEYIPAQVIMIEDVCKK